MTADEYADACNALTDWFTELAQARNLSQDEAVAILGTVTEGLIKAAWQGDERRRVAAKFAHIFHHVMALPDDFDGGSTVVGWH